MDIIVKLKVTMNADARKWWDITYGNGADAVAVRADVRSYLLNHSQQAAGILESGAEVTLQP